MGKICVIIKKLNSKLKTSLHSAKWTFNKEYGARVKKKGPVKRDVTNNKELRNRMQRKGSLSIKLPLSIAPSQTTVTKALINGGAFTSSEETFLCREK